MTEDHLEHYNRMCVAEAQVQIQLSKIDKLQRDLEKAREDANTISDSSGASSEVVSTVLSTITSASDSWQEQVTLIRAECDQRIREVQAAHKSVASPTGREPEVDSRQLQRPVNALFHLGKSLWE